MQLDPIFTHVRGICVRDQGYYLMSPNLLCISELSGPGR